MPCERARRQDQIKTHRAAAAAEIVWVRDKSIEDARTAGQGTRFFLTTVRLA